MKKIFMLLASALLAWAGMQAQDVPMATLQNAEGTQVFYGSDAFKNAAAAADHGNTITLSIGLFNAPTLTKAVVVYGAGADISSGSAEVGQDSKRVTQVNGDLTLAIDSVDGKPSTGLYMEGLFLQNAVWVAKHLENASFVKCRFYDFNFWKDKSTMTSSQMCFFFQCRFANWLEPGVAEALTVHNSVINQLGRSPENSSLLVQNSVVNCIVNSLKNCVFKNNIVHYVRDYQVSAMSFQDMSGNTTGKLPSSCSAYQNAFYSSGSISDVIVKVGNWENVTSSSLFGSGGSFEYSDTATYELTDEAKTKYIGTDGNPIGLYGGEAPFNTKPSIPYVVSKNIANKSENGKLKVSIKVAVPEGKL